MRDYQNDTFDRYYPASRLDVLFFSEKAVRYPALFLAIETSLRCIATLPNRRKMKRPASLRAFDFIGAGERSRTPDLRITNALLYLLSYTGAERRIIEFRRWGLKPAPAKQTLSPT
jgi:hypothetical protein